MKIKGNIKKEKYYTFFIILLVFSCIYCGVGQIILNREVNDYDGQYELFDYGWVSIDEHGRSYIVRRDMELFPSYNEKVGKECVYLANVLPSYEVDNTVLLFWNREYKVKVYIDGKLRLDFPNENYSLFGDMPAAEFLQVKLGEADKSKLLEMYIYGASDVYLPTTYLGDYSAIKNEYIRPFFLEIILALFLIVICVVCIIISIVMEHLFCHEIILKYFCWATLTTSVWLMANSVARQFVFKNVVVTRDLAFMSISLIPIPFFIFEDKMQKGRYHKIYKFFSYYSLFVFVSTFLLHVFEISNLKESQRAIQGCIFIGVTLIVVLIIVDSVRGYVKEYFLTAVGYLIMAIFSLIHTISYIVSVDKALRSVFVEIGLMACLVISIVNMVKDVDRLQIERKNAIYANQAKDNFLARMSHEIRTPINAVLGMDEMILRECKDDSILEYASQIKVSGNTLLSLVNDILDFSKIESGKMELIEVEYDMATMIMDVVNMIKPRSDSKKLFLECHIDENIPNKLKGDDIRIKQILVNLLTNAVKYTHEGRVVFEGNVIDKTDDTVKIQFKVTDTGIGIKEEDKNRLFSSFERVDEKKNRNIEGTGLGLSITARLLELMGSKIEVESEYGKGSEFSFVLEQTIVDSKPMGDFKKHYMEEVKAKKEYQNLFYAPNASLLVVDDVAVILAVVKGLLKKTKINVDTAQSGIKCIQKMKAKHYDIVLLDHFMPDMDGVETLKEIRRMEDKRSRETIVIVLTANAIAGEREKYIELGFNDFLEKPVDGKVLEEMLIKYLPKNLIESRNDVE